jgi:membrane-associated phospholipid phosphatase
MNLYIAELLDFNFQLALWDKEVRYLSQKARWWRKEEIVKKLLVFLLVFFMFGANTARAQSRGQRVADIASYATLGFNITLDARRSWQATDRGHQLLMLAVRYAVVGLTVDVLKTAFPRQRPCAAGGTCGIDRPDSDFPSGHTAFAFATLGHPTEEQGEYLVKLGGAMLTGVLRMEANKHDLLGVLGGAAVGIAGSRLR